MSIFDLFRRRKNPQESDDGRKDATFSAPEQSGMSQKSAMLAELMVDPYFAVHPRYSAIFSRMPDDDTRGQACEDFAQLLEQSRVETLMAVLAWKGDCTGMGCNHFIFAMYDDWFEPITPKALWKIHLVTEALDVSPTNSSIIYTPLARIMVEALRKGRPEYVPQLEAATPTGAEEHFNQLVQKVRESVAS